MLDRQTKATLFAGLFDKIRRELVEKYDGSLVSFSFTFLLPKGL